MLSPLQQAIDLAQKSKNVLIALPENLNGDSLGCALALENVFKSFGKKIDIVSTGAIPEKLKFLPGLEIVKEKPVLWRDFIISINTSENKISRLRYEKENDLLKIFLTSNQKVEEHDIKLEAGSFFYDLIVAIDAPDLEALGPLFENNTNLFFSKPVLNIDHKSANEYFGEINLVEPTAASCSEIVAGLIEKLGPDLIDAPIATLLLTGLVFKTRSFQNTKTTPQALNLAALLISRGGEQEKIIQNLYKTTPLNHLKLWGRLLSQISFEQQKNLIWLSASPEDFHATQTSAKDLTFILEEIDNLFPQIDLSFILWSDETGTVWVLSRAKRSEILQKISLEFGGTLKNDKLLLKLAEPSTILAKEKISQLLTSRGLLG